jgi:hypothetical protein
MIKDFEQRVAMHLKSLEAMELVTVVETEQVQAYYIKQLGTRIMSTLVTFTPEGIVLQGDFTPEQNGTVSCRNYGCDWFAGQLSSAYLCEKFLQHKWVKEVAVECLTDPESYLREGRDSQTIEELNRLAGYVDGGAIGGEGVHDRLTDLGIDVETTPGWAYDPDEAASLVAIQRKFAELWAKQQGMNLKGQ